MVGEEDDQGKGVQCFINSEMFRNQTLRNAKLHFDTYPGKEVDT